MSAEQRHNVFSLPSDVGTSAFATVRDGRGASRSCNDSFLGGRDGSYSHGVGNSRNYNGDSIFSPMASSVLLLVLVVLL